MVKPGKYQHYKGNYYEVLGVGRHSEDLGEFVVYRALYDSPDFAYGSVWVRPKSLFTDTVIFNGEEVPHFKKVEEIKLDDERMDKIFSFLKTSEKLKQVERAIMTSPKIRYENSAEHSWHTGLLLLTIKDQFPHANLERMLKMILIHDLIEIYAGDTPAYDVKGKETQAEREKEAAKKLFFELPDNLREEFHDLFNEFEMAVTKEAKIVRSCDKIQAMLQNIITEGKTWQDNKLDLNWVEGYNKKFMVHNNTFMEIYSKLFKEVKERNLSWRNENGVIGIE
tara:strand:- start:799 stop:1641 length:843 start_codon:yes stop_codon:yes gene_type:complete